MADTIVGFDPDAADGSKFADEVKAEIAAIAPSTIAPGSVSTTKLADSAVTNPKLAVNAVKSPNIGTGEVKQVNIAAGAVGNTQLGAGAVTAAKTGIGVLTVKDSDDNDMQLTALFLSSSAYAALTDKDPNTLYLTWTG